MSVPPPPAGSGRSPGSGWPGSGWRVAPILLLLAVGVVLQGCRDLVVDPAPATSAGLALSLAPPPASQLQSADGAGAAFDRADAIHVRLHREGEVAAEVSQAFESEGNRTRVPVEVDVEGGEESFVLEVGLLWQGSALFTAEQTVVLQAGESNEVEVDLDPVAVGIEVEDGPVVLEALGEQAQIEAAVVFATGDPIPGLPVAWSSSDPEVVQVTHDGQATAVSEGQVQVVGMFEEFSDAVVVTVEQVVASVDVTPGQVTLSPGQTTRLDVALSDANGHAIPLAGRTVTWASSSPDVASVDDNGVVRGEAPGQATITASSEGESGQAAIEVEEPDIGSITGQWEGMLDAPEASCLLTLDITQDEVGSVSGTAQAYEPCLEVEFDVSGELGVDGEPGLVYLEFLGDLFGFEFFSTFQGTFDGEDTMDGAIVDPEPDDDCASPGCPITFTRVGSATSADAAAGRSAPDGPIGVDALVRPGGESPPSPWRVPLRP